MLIEMSKGKQLTLPAGLRAKYGLEEGSRMEVEDTGKGILIRPMENDLEEVFKATDGIKPAHNWDADEMDKEIENAIHRQ